MKYYFDDTTKTFHAADTIPAGMFELTLTQYKTCVDSLAAGVTFRVIGAALVDFPFARYCLIDANGYFVKQERPIDSATPELLVQIDPPAPEKFRQAKYDSKSHSWTEGNPKTTAELLLEAFTEKCASVDYVTGQLIAPGFEYPAASGQVFSLSSLAQVSLLGLHSAALNNKIPAFPYSVNQLDDTKQAVALVDNADVIAYCETGFYVITAHKSTGRAQKDVLRGYYNAGDLLSLQNYVDPRVV